MKKVLFCFFAFVLFLPLISNGQYTLNLQWAKPIGDSLGDEILFSIDKQENKLVLAGNIGAEDSAFSEVQPIKSSDYAWLMETDTNGNKIWSRTYPATFLRGYFGVDHSIWVFGQNGDSTGEFANTGYSERPVVIKFDSLGNVLWYKYYGTNSGDDVPTYFTTTSDGGAIFLLDFNYPSGDIPYKYGNDPFNANSWLCKIDSNGVIQWGLVLGGTGDQQSSMIKELQPGRYTVLINTNSIDSMLLGINFNSAIISAWLLEVDSDGNILNSRIAQNDNDAGYFDFATTKNGGVILAAKEQPDSGDYCYPGLGAGDFTTLKADSNYQHEWCKINGGENDDVLYQVISINDSVVAIGGSSESTTNDLASCSGYPLSYAHSHVWYALLNINTQQIIWEKALCGSGEDEFESFWWDSINNELYVLVAGNSIDGDFAGIALNDSGNVYLFKYSLDHTTGIPVVSESSNAIKIYPNPASSYVLVDYNGFTDNSKIEIVDVFGRIITTLPANSNTGLMQIDTKEFSDGMYFVTIECDGVIKDKGKFNILK